MKLDIDKEIAWMRNFKVASRLSPEAFEVVLCAQRQLFERRQGDIVRDPHSNAYYLEGHNTCYDCGAIASMDDDCPICATVNRDKLPPMAWGIVFDSPEQFQAWKETAL